VSRIDGPTVVETEKNRFGLYAGERERRKLRQSEKARSVDSQ